MGDREPTHSNDFTDKNYINKNSRLRGGERENWQTKHFTKTKRTVYPCLPKLHLTCSRYWTAHEDTRFWWKSQSSQLWQTSVICRGSPQVLIFPFQPLLSKFWGVKPELPILQDIPAGYSEHSRCLEKSFVNLEFCWEALLSFYALASLRNHKSSLK